VAPEPTANPAQRAVSAAEIAEAAGASDLFVFRRVGGRRFAHIGGAGRGAGWAGIVDISADEEPLVGAALSGDSVVRRSQAEPRQVFGPYYARSVAVVRLSDDTLVVFGYSDDIPASVSDEELSELAQFASEGVLEVAPAKRLADELEVLNAVQDLLHGPAETFDQALQHLVDQATLSLSCEVGVAYIPELGTISICDRREALRLSLRSADVADALAVIAERRSFPLCIQRADADELPAPFRSADGVLAYYLLELTRPHAGFLLLVHTKASAPRGFTLLCQSLGTKLVDAAEPLLVAALLRDTMRDELERVSAEARSDPVTGLANRLAWNEKLLTATPSIEEPLSIIQCDCRGLKQINDTHGHIVGDELLRRVAAVLTSSVRTHDLVARIGGDEFAILLNGGEDMAHAIVERIEAALVVGRAVGQPAIQLAIGTSTARDESLEATQQRADAQMLEAKRLPRGASRRMSA
jgi:diguanylate cyclase (GGDEF)-like protein